MQTRSKCAKRFRILCLYARIFDSYLNNLYRAAAYAYKRFKMDTIMDTIIDKRIFLVFFFLGSVGFFFYPFDVKYREIEMVTLQSITSKMKLIFS